MLVMDSGVRRTENHIIMIFRSREQTDMITSSNNAKVKQVVQWQTKAKERRKDHVFLAEGVRMCEEAPVKSVREVYLTEELEQKLGFAARLRTLSVELDQASELVSLMKQENSDQRLERLGGILSDIRRGL